MGQATGLAFRFVIGGSKNVKKITEVHKEIDKHIDFLVIDIKLGFFKAAFQLFEPDYYVKVDDDIYLRIDRLATLLAKEQTHSQAYIVCMNKGPVITNPKMKWYEKS